MSRATWWMLVVVTAVGVGCTGKTTLNSGGDDDCPAGETREEASGECVATGGDDVGVDTGGDAGEMPVDVAGSDGGGDSAEQCEQWEERDDDGHLCRFDNCPGEANPDQKDSDDDGVGNACDNCPEVANRDQADSDGDGTGDACEEGAYYDATRDSDGDGVPDVDDNCPETANKEQKDPDGDNLGTACDNCPEAANYDQTDSNGDGTGDACTPRPVGRECGRKTGDFKEVDPNVYLVLDKSGSMGGGKMSQAKNALGTIADRLANEVRFGLLAYSGSCSPPELLSMGNHSSSKIKSSYSGVSAGGGTATGGALRRVRKKRYFWDSGDSLRKSRPKAVVIITDGNANSCGGQTRAARESKRLLKKHGVKVYVVGFRSGASPSNLDEMARKGGTNNHYTANSAGSLANVLQNISDKVIACTYKLDEPSEGIDPNKVWVAINGNHIGSDKFDYDPMSKTVTLEKGACKRLRSSNPGNSTDPLTIVLGCPTECDSKSEEKCDYKDNDCDGEIDEGCEGCTKEKCDGQDNDCDGEVDEGCPDCGLSGAMCESDGECCNGSCTDGVCGSPCRPLGVKCRQDSECCSGQCGDGRCLGG